MNIPLGRRIKNLGRRIKDFFLSWAGEIRRSPGQNKTAELQDQKQKEITSLNFLLSKIFRISLNFIFTWDQGNFHII